MSYFEKFCSECGSRLEGAKICPKCGFEVPEETPTTVEEASTIAKKKSATKSAPRSGNDSTWKSMEDIIAFVGRYSYIVLAIIAFFSLIGAILGFVFSAVGTGIYGLLCAIITGYLIWTYGKVFSEKSKEKDWSFLVNDVLVIGSFRIPKMLAYGLVLWAFAWGTGFILVVIPAALIIFMGPEEFSWSTK